MDDWIEAQKQRLLQNSEANVHVIYIYWEIYHGKFACLCWHLPVHMTGDLCLCTACYDTGAIPACHWKGRSIACEACKQSGANGEFGCLLCKLGGGRTAYSTLTVTFPWNKKKKTVSCHRFAYMLHMQCLNCLFLFIPRKSDGQCWIGRLPSPQFA
jgi:hypothetical protein